ncbi:MAG: nicotinate (nicotinamide) nucleotide adenylyltransferase [Leptospiraceae bacterium]|nr:nicotinate (nicotinamide) nucleotide adenylyltransferase [Leptospiraceae bacterium]MCB1314304.1 nicotinate (nicotinamide) nucleotide adenylyltransferase [Leptospiraceae bacterium]
MTLPVDRLIFGGSFDPPHRGHLAMLEYVLTANCAEHVDLIPAAVSPFKQDRPPAASGQQRLHMLTLLLEDLRSAELREHTTIRDHEILAPPPSYTVDTCARLRAEFPAQSIGILIGGDSLADLDAWHRIADILAHHPFLVFARPDADQALLSTQRTRLLRAFPENRDIIILQNDFVDCQSTAIRAALAMQDWTACRACLPPGVLEYIQINRLYRN